MTTNAKWIVGLLIVLVLGLGIALVVSSGGDDEPSTVTETGPTVTQPQTITQPPPTTPTQPPTTPTPPTELPQNGGSGGVSP